MLQSMGSQRVRHDLATEQHSWLKTLVTITTAIRKKESESEVAQACPTLCDLMACSSPGSSVHGIFQARVLERVAISFSRRSSWPRDRTRVSCIAGRCFTIWATSDLVATITALISWALPSPGLWHAIFHVMLSTALWGRYDDPRPLTNCFPFSFQL